MAPGSTRGSKGRRQGPKDWLVPVTVLVFALITAVLVERLYESALRSQDVQTLLVQIEEEVNEQQLGEYEAIAEGEVTPEISGQIAESRADIQRSLNKLEAQAPDEHPERIRELLVTGEAAIDEELRLIEDGRIDEAEAVDEEVVDPTFEELREVLESADTGLGNYSDRVDVIADVGGFAVASLSVLLTAWFVWRDRNRRAEQEALEESEERFRSLVQEGADLMWILDADGTVRYVAPSVERVLGHAVSDVVGRDVFGFLAPDEEGIRQDILDVLREPGAKITTELRARRDNGSRALFEATFSNMLANPGVGGIALNARDITERKEAEAQIRHLNEELEGRVRERTAQLRASEARLRALFAAMTDVILVLDSEGRYLEIAPTNPSLLYTPPEEAIGRTLHEIFPKEQADEFMERIRAALGTGRTVGIQYSLRIRGQEVWFDGTVSPMQEDAVLFVARDVTERRQAEEELRSYARKLAQSNRELQEFAYVASHDLQEPLRKVRTFGDRLRSKYADALGEQGRDYLNRMEGSAERMQGLIEDLLALSRVTTKGKPFAPVDLCEVVAEVLSDLEARIEQVGGRVEVGPLPSVEADRSQMRQLFQNLLSNALKFRREGERPVVKVRAELPRGGGEEGNSEDVEVCRIVVEDNGIGLEEEYLERIFAPFERLHGRGSYEGTGMGLAICRKVVERHGGTISAQSAPGGQGAAFVVTLPLEQPATKSGTKTHKRGAEGGGAHDYAALGR